MEHSSVASGSAPVASGCSRNDDTDPLEIDLSELLDRLEAPSSSAGGVEPPGPPDLEAVFQEIRARVTQEQHGAAATTQYHRALDRIVGGDMEGAIADLQAVARVPLFRFAASTQLARLLVERGDLRAAVDWFERAAEAPAPTAADRYALLYDLGDTLERIGESARARAVLLELDGEAGGYRDVRARIEQLSRAQA